MNEQKHIDVGFRGQTYRITVDHAHMLNRRGHLRSYGHGTTLRYYVEDDRMIDVRGEPTAETKAA